MKGYYIKQLLFLSLVSTNLTAQISTVNELFQLPSELSESSGAIIFNNHLITHNDSGNSNILYELDLTSGIVVREVVVSGATNIDWEDITQDDEYIYVGDIGNNNGDRLDLKIYKISKNAYLAADEVSAEVITFYYGDQTDFISSPQNTQWDAEALSDYDTDNIMLFSKNWVLGITSAYLLPKLPGSYVLTALPTTLDAQGLITGATFNKLSSHLVLVGYTNPTLQPFIWICENFVDDDVFSGSNMMFSMANTFSFEQIEAIDYTSDNTYLITSESFAIGNLSDYAKLIELITEDTSLTIQDVSFQEKAIFYPNPVGEVLTIKGRQINKVEVYDAKGTLLFKDYTNQIDMSLFAQGIYHIKVSFTDGHWEIKKVVHN